MLNTKRASYNTSLKVLGMTWPRIYPWSTTAQSDVLPTVLFEPVKYFGSTLKSCCSDVCLSPTITPLKVEVKADRTCVFATLSYQKLYRLAKSLSRATNSSVYVKSKLPFYMRECNALTCSTEHVKTHVFWPELRCTALLNSTLFQPCDDGDALLQDGFPPLLLSEASYLGWPI